MVRMPRHATTFLDMKRNLAEAQIAERLKTPLDSYYLLARRWIHLLVTHANSQRLSLSLFLSLSVCLSLRSLSPPVTGPGNPVHIFPRSINLPPWKKDRFGELWLPSLSPGSNGERQNRFTERGSLTFWLEIWRRSRGRIRAIRCQEELVTCKFFPRDFFSFSRCLYWHRGCTLARSFEYTKTRRLVWG